MKKILSFILTIIFTLSFSINTISCNDIDWDCIFTVCYAYDENNEKIETTDFIKKQYFDYLFFHQVLSYLPKTKIKNSQDLLEMLNNKTSQEILDNYNFDHKGNLNKNPDLSYFKNRFITKTSTYKELNIEALSQIKESLKGMENTTYLFTNFSDNNVDNLINAKELNFQLIFITKISDNKIIGNIDNNHFFFKKYYDYKENINTESPYFFDFTFSDNMKWEYRVIKY